MQNAVGICWCVASTEQTQTDLIRCPCLLVWLLLFVRS